jgi:hypothetical protein
MMLRRSLFAEFADRCEPSDQSRPHNLIHERDFVILYSETKAGKTLAAIDMELQMATFGKN